VVSLYDVGQQKDITRRPSIENFGWQIRRISKSAALDENGREVWYSCSPYRYSGAYPGLEAEERGQGELSPEIYLKWFV
jgi:hypothetical protein